MVKTGGKPHDLGPFTHQSLRRGFHLCFLRGTKIKRYKSCILSVNGYVSIVRLHMILFSCILTSNRVNFWCEQLTQFGHLLCTWSDNSDSVLMVQCQRMNTPTVKVTSFLPLFSLLSLPSRAETQATFK